MKTMKQISTLFAAIVMALSLAACGGGAEKTVVLRGDVTDDMGGIPTTDTWTLTAKGDIVQTLKEVFELDLSEYDDETREYFTSLLDSLILEPAKDIEGVTATSRMTGTTYVVEMTIDCTGNAVKEAVAADLLEVDGNADFISLKQTQASLEQQGYEVVE